MSIKHRRFEKVDGEVIFVDESGNPDLSATSKRLYPYYSIGFVYCKNPSQLRTDLKRMLKRIHERDRYPPDITELKFYLPMSELVRLGYEKGELDEYLAKLPNVRQKSLEVICKNATKIFAAVLIKKKALGTWTSERIGNYLFAQTLVLDVMNNISPQYPPSILYDPGRLSPSQTDEFKQYLNGKDHYFERMGIKQYEGHLPNPQARASHIEPGIWAADLVAGAFNCKYTNNDSSYSELLKTKCILHDERLYWP
jgi:hypothetical protein